MKRLLFLFGPLFLFSLSISAQSMNEGQLHGSVEIDAQTYTRDSAIGAPAVPEKMGLNSFAQLDYTNGKISAGVRYEAYENALQGYDARYNGQGIAYKYLRFADSSFDVTVGNFYEQFGSGLILRSYWQYQLGVDNSIDGVRLKYNLCKGISVKGIIGHQRYYWGEGTGIVRGIDGEINLNQLLPGWDSVKTKIILGGSFVSKYQVPDNTTYNVPGNVGATAGRITINNGGFSLYSEYAYKINDPSVVNGYIYKPGQAFLLRTGYSTKGFSFSVSGESMDNMSFKSDRTAVKNDLDINYLPTLPRDETYQLAQIYPYATQPNGEMGVDAEVRYTLPKESLFGGKYGTELDVEFSAINALDTTNLNDLNTTRQGYSVNYFGVSDRIYFNNTTIELKHKFSPKFRMILQYVDEAYNKDVIQQEVGYGIIHCNIGIVDGYYRITSSNTLHFEVQELETKKDQGSWAFGMAEMNFGSNWFVGALDEYNYGNPIASQQIHYYTLTGGYTHNALRISIGYGKTRSGILCVGGVCRQIPASDGFSISITNSF
ncbi:MAG TPA: DUF6029 family protein, partial [Bacteroidia bacterium]|nr:DUF6029 family protein [Bacteroidia bacterium]